MRIRLYLLIIHLYRYSFFYSNKHESEKALFLAVVAILVSIKLTDVKALTAERVAATAKRVNFILTINLIY